MSTMDILQDGIQSQEPADPRPGRLGREVLGMGKLPLVTWDAQPGL